VKKQITTDKNLNNMFDPIGVESNLINKEDCPPQPYMLQLMNG
jgi:hypothetical protein